MKPFYIFIIAFFISIIGFSQTNNGKLKKAKTSIKKQSNTSSRNNARSSSTSTNNNINENSFFSNVFMSILYNITYGIVIESVFEKESLMHSANLSEYPYKNDSIGNFTYGDDYKLARVSISNDFVRESKNLYGNDINIKVNFLKRMDVEVDYLHLVEKLSNETDSFSMHSALINYHRIRTQKLDFWFGLGAMYVGNEVKETGFAYNLGAEWFVKKPISLYVNTKGTAINDQSISKTKIGAKYHIKNYTINSGYQQFKLGISDINTFSIGVGVVF